MDFTNDFDLARFVTAQERKYPTALAEMRQVLSSNGMKYGIATIAEAQAYLKHTELGERLVEITQVALDSSTKNTRTLMGSEIDVAKMHTCMTLFLRADPDKKVFDFQALLDKYYNGAPYAELDMMLGL